MASRTYAAVSTVLYGVGRDVTSHVVWSTIIVTVLELVGGAPGGETQREGDSN